MNNKNYNDNKSSGKNFSSNFNKKQDSKSGSYAKPYDKDSKSSSYSKPYDKDSKSGSYAKPYDKDSKPASYAKPYDKDSKSTSYAKPYDKDSKSASYAKPYDKDSKTSSYPKAKEQNRGKSFGKPSSSNPHKKQNSSYASHSKSYGIGASSEASYVTSQEHTTKPRSYTKPYERQEHTVATHTNPRQTMENLDEDFQTPIVHNSQREDVVCGRNGVIELLKSDRQVECIYIQRGDLQGSITRIVAIAKEKAVPLKEVSIVKLDALTSGSSHQGVVAIASVGRYKELEDIFANSTEKPPFIIIADCIEDPHNLGALIRTAEAAGADGLIVPKRNSAGLTFTVSKTSAGAVEHLPIVRVSNLASTVELLKEKGLWIYCADGSGENWCEVDYSGGVALIIGSEGSGVSRLLRDKCDFTVSLPMCGKIESLNASVAAGIVMYEIARQRLGLKSK